MAYTSKIQNFIYFSHMNMSRYLGFCPRHVQLVGDSRANSESALVSAFFSLFLWKMVKIALLWLFCRCLLWISLEFMIHLVGDEDASLWIIFALLSVMTV